jgi:uncharacterized protein (UPF0332 family)
LARDLKFVKHTGVRSALHRHLIREGFVDDSWGRFYDRAFDSRQRGDYQELVSFEPEQVTDICRLSRGFLAVMRSLVKA